jgi:hypothetical protein
MRSQVLVTVAALCVLGAASGRAQDSHAYNVHIGGGVGVPLGTTSDFAGISGTFQFGAGPNLNEHSSIVGEFMWHGLPPTQNVLSAIATQLGTSTIPPSVTESTSLYALTANYMYRRGGYRYGFYLIGGGGWYYRHTSLNGIVVAPGTVCQPIFGWWGYSCANGLVSSNFTLATKGVSSGGVNGGIGITINLGDSGFKYYMEARYHYSPQGGRVSTQVIPVTLGFRW